MDETEASDPPTPSLAQSRYPGAARRRAKRKRAASRPILPLVVPSERLGETIEAPPFRALGVVEQFAVAHHAATDEPIGGRCRDVLEAAARAALIAEGVRIGLCEHELRLTIESAFTAGRERPRCAPNRLR